MRRKNKLGKVLLILAVILIFLFGVIYVSLVMPLQKVMAKTTRLRQISTKTFAAAKTQDLNGLKDNLVLLQKEVLIVEKDLKSVFAYKTLPWVGFVFADSENALSASKYLLAAGKKAVDAIEPYADLIGMKKGSQFSAQPTEKRLETAILTIDKLNPKIDKIDIDLEKAKVYLEKIDPNKYPEKIGKMVIREKIKNYYDQIFGLLSLATDAKPLLKKLPYLLGKDEERRYLLLFLNDKELRATGGFITAYAIFGIDRGQIRVKEASDIYDLDDAITHPIAPPEILTYHKGVPRFMIRDSNLSPDNVKSIELFEGLLAKSSKKLDYDGIITIDTQVLVRTLAILGPTDAGDFTFKADIDPRCDCPQVIYELENMITRPTPYFRTNRKSMLSTLLYAIMQKSLGVSPSKYWGRLIQSFLTDLDEKHILVYLNDKSSQLAIESLNYGGRIVDFKGDYLHVNNVNFAGAKSNMYLKNTTISKTEVQGDKLKRELTLEYRNIYQASDCNLERGGLCLNAPLRNWVRIYVPLGAKLTNFIGSEMKVQKYEDLGKQVFEGFLVINPMGKATVKITYELPKSIMKNKRYQLMIQKQPGVEEIQTTVIYNNETQTEVLRKDTTFSF